MTNVTRQKADRRATNRDVVHAVDLTLTGLPPRELVTYDEATDVLGRVADLADGSDVGDAADLIVEGALESFRDWPAVDRVRVIDPLLDVRNLAAGVGTGRER